MMTTLTLEGRMEMLEYIGLLENIANVALTAFAAYGIKVLWELHKAIKLLEEEGDEDDV